MRNVATLITLFDLWCLLAIGSAVDVFLTRSLPVQLVNDVVLMGITYFWLRQFLPQHRHAGIYYQLSWGLRELALALPMVLFVVALIKNFI